MLKMKIETIRQRVISSLSTKPVEFIQPITSPTLIIEEPDSPLKELKILEVPHDDQGTQLWKINLEKDIKGFTPRCKTVEIAIAHLRKRTLTLYLIELKHSINHKSGRTKTTLESIHGKFEESISRFYYLLTMDNCIEWKDFKNWKVKFKGIVCYNKRSKITMTESSRIYKVLTNDTKNGLIECNTYPLGKIKIEVAFIENKVDEEIMEITYNQIENAS